MREDAEDGDNVERSLVQPDLVGGPAAGRVVATVPHVEVPEPEPRRPQVPGAPAHVWREHVDPEIGALEAPARQGMRKPPVPAADVENAGVRAQPAVQLEALGEVVADREVVVIGLAHEPQPPGREPLTVATQELQHT